MKPTKLDALNIRVTRLKNLIIMYVHKMKLMVNVLLRYIDEFLIAALHSSDCSLEQAKQLVETNITSRTDYEFFSNRDPLTKSNQAVWNCM